MTKKEFKKIKKISKKILDKKSHRKIKDINDILERTESLKYLIASKLKLQHLELESKIKGIEKKEALIIESKLSLLNSKIKIFETTYSKRDLVVIQNIIKKIEKEMENVQLPKKEKR